MLHSEQKAYVHIQSKTKYAANISMRHSDENNSFYKYKFKHEFYVSYFGNLFTAILNTAFLLTCKHNTAVTAHFILLVTKKLMVLPFVVDCTHTE